MQFPPTALDSLAAREAIRIIDRLREAGFTAVLAGGCVRDALLGRIPKDFDVATDATPDSVQQVFGRRHTIAFGASFGVIGVLPPKHRSQPGHRDEQPQTLMPTEVATFRADGNYSDGRRPDHVTYGTAEADAARRDFTINGLFYDPSRDEILDYVDGLKDLKSMHLRTIGDADRRFDEDKLRMLRAVRFVTTLRLTVEPSTLAAIERHADSLSRVSGERIGAEMRRVMSQVDAVRGLELLVGTGLHRQVWPGLNAMNWQRLEQRAARIEQSSFEVGMAVTLATLHDHTDDAIDNLNALTENWKLSTAEQRAIQTSLELATVLLDCAELSWSALQPLLINRDIDIVVSVASVLAEDEQGMARVKVELQRDAVSLNPPPLLSGDDLIAAGISAGPHFRIWLSELRRMQLDDTLSTPEQAMAWVQSQVK